MAGSNGTFAVGPEKRLGLLCQHFYPEMKGTGLHMTELATSLARRGWRLRVYCSYPTGPIADEDRKRELLGDHEGVEVVRVRPLGRHEGGIVARLVFGVSYMIAIAFRIVRDRQELAGLIVTTSPPFVGLAALLARRLFAIPYVQIGYDLFPDSAVHMGAIGANSPITRIWRRVTRAIFRGAALVVAIGRDMAEIVAAMVGSRAKVIIIPNWSDEAKVWPMPRAENAFVRAHGLRDKTVVQYSGNLGRNHDIECLIEAAKLLADDPRVVFQFVGGGAKKSLMEKKARDAGLTNVRFVPLQPASNLASVLSAAHLGVVALGKPYTGLSVPSKTYGIMASGVPILAMMDDRSEVGRAVVENHCGVVLPDASAAEVADVVRQLVNEPARFADMGGNGRRAFLKSYTLSKAADRYSAALEASFGDAACERTEMVARTAS